MYFPLGGLTGLNDYKDEDRLDKFMPEQLCGEAMATKILSHTQDEKFTTRPEMMELLMSLVYFGIGGGINSCARYLKWHLNGRPRPVRPRLFKHVFLNSISVTIPRPESKWALISSAKQGSKRIS
jgi:hypothetical protein